jgi:hypothetical protein
MAQGCRPELVNAAVVQSNSVQAITYIQKKKQNEQKMKAMRPSSEEQVRHQ